MFEENILRKVLFEELILQLPSIKSIWKNIVMHHIGAITINFLTEVRYLY